MDQAELAATEVAFEQAYADWNARQAYYQQNAGIPAGWDPPPHPDDWYRHPAGLGYSNPPPEIAVYQADEPSLVPSPLPVPAAFDVSAPPSVTGSVHGWGPRAGSPNPAARAGESVVYLGLGDDAPAPPRRSLLNRLLGRGRA
jgi:hypothetical protein